MHSIRIKQLLWLTLVVAGLSQQTGCPAGGNPPQVYFGASPLSGPAPLNCRFTDTSELNGESLQSKLWDFGDGATSTENEPFHLYAVPGDYSVTLSLTTTGGSNSLLLPGYIKVRPVVEPEGESEGEGEGVLDGEGVMEGEGTAEGEGGIEGIVDGEGTVDGEGAMDGEGAADGEGSIEGEGEGDVVDPVAGEIRTFLGESYVWIPAGEFTMGTNRTAEELEDIYGDRAFYFKSEQPAHTVQIRKGFWMERHEMCQAYWLRYRSENPSLTKGASNPVESVSWNEAQALIADLNALGEGTFRLPTEAEWEYACRAGTSTEFSFGDNVADLKNYGWFFGNTQFKTKPIGMLLPNPWGLYDIHGNVFEWCSDWYSETYYAESPTVDPAGPATGDYKVRRGGAYLRTDAFCRSSFRLWNAPDGQLEFIGIRLVREAD